MLCLDDDIQLEDEVVETSLESLDEQLDESDHFESELDEKLDVTELQLRL